MINSKQNTKSRFLKSLALLMLLLFIEKTNTSSCTVSNGDVSLTNNQTYSPKIIFSSQLSFCPSTLINLNYSVAFNASSCTVSETINIPCINNTWKLNVTSPCSLTGVDEQKKLRMIFFANASFSSPSSNFSSVCSDNTQYISIKWGNPKPDDSSESGLDLFVIVGVAVGGIVVIGIIGFIVWRMKCRRSKLTLLTDSEH